MFDFGRHHVQQIRRWGKSYTIETDAGQSTLDGVFRDPYIDQSVGSYENTTQPDPSLRALEQEVNAVPVVAGDRVLVEGATYTVVDLVPHDQGVVDLVLKRYGTPI